MTQGEESLQDPLVSKDSGEDCGIDIHVEGLGLNDDQPLVDPVSLCESNQSNLCELVSLSIPVIFSNVLTFLMSLMSMAFVGRMLPGENSLAASILATTLFNATGLSLLAGCTSAMETISGNAYGMGRYETVGHVFQKALALDAVLCWSIILFWTYGVEYLLLGYVGHEIYVPLASRYLRTISPGLFLHAIFESLRRYLGCQKIVSPVTWSTFLGFLSCPVYNYLLIRRFGLDGAAMAQVCIMLTQTGALVIMTMVIEMNKSSGMPRTWNGISWEALTRFSGYTEFLHLAIPGLFMILSEWWAFEVLVILAGMLPSGDTKVQVSAMGIIVQISGLVWTIVSAVCFAGSILISTSLGHGKPENALSHSRELFKVTFSIEACMAILLIFMRNHIGKMFTSSEDVVLAIANALPIFAITLVPDGINIPIQNILKACGKQKFGALLNMLYWIVAPLGYLLGIHYGLLLKGLWISILAVNTLLCMALSLSYSLAIDFDRESQQALQRVHAMETDDSRNDNNNMEI